MSVNKVILIGNLGDDPELRETANGNSVCELRIATNEKWYDKEGELQERTTWHTIVVWGAQGENCEKYLSKGRPVYVEGRLQTRTWENDEGETKYFTEVVAQNVVFLAGGDGGEREERPKKKRGATRGDRARRPKGRGGRRRGGRTRRQAEHVEDPRELIDDGDE